MRRLAAVILISLCALPAVASVAEAQRLLKEGRELIDAREYQRASQVLGEGMKAANDLSGSDRDAAVSAVSFYSALAEFGLGNAKRTREHLEAFVRLSPNARISDPARYPAGFVAVFNEISARSGDEKSTFDRFYPGFDENASPENVPKIDDIAWGSSPAVELLGSRDERREWADGTSANERNRFLERFWGRRDPTPETQRNEARERFERRLAFADRTFTSEGQRGGLTDRGRIFVLLGAPGMVQRRALMNRDNVIVLHEMVDGTMELWVYAKEQLPIRIPKRAVQYRFVTQKGIGEGVLQRREEAYATRVLAAAGEATILRK